MKPALIITHLPDRQDGIVREALEAAGCAVIERNPDDAEALPSALQVAGHSRRRAVSRRSLRLGSQAHLELTPSMLIEGWTADLTDIERAGHRIEEFRAQSRDHQVTQMAAARPMFTAFGRLATSCPSSA